MNAQELIKYIENAADIMKTDLTIRMTRTKNGNYEIQHITATHFLKQIKVNN